MTNQAAKELGRLGGLATKAKLGIKHFKRISALGVKARKAKLSPKSPETAGE